MVWLHQSNFFHQKHTNKSLNKSHSPKNQQVPQVPSFLRFFLLLLPSSYHYEASELPHLHRSEKSLALIRWIAISGCGSPKWGFQSNHWNKKHEQKPEKKHFFFVVALDIQISNSAWDLNGWTLIKPCDVRFSIAQKDEPKGPTCLDECACFDEAEFHGRPHMVQMRASKIPTISVASVVQVPDEFMRSLYTYDTTRLHYMYSTYIYI